VFLSGCQAIRSHTFVPELSTPGDADLSADVDFSALARVFKQSGERLVAFFLFRMSISLLRLAVDLSVTISVGLSRMLTPGQASPFTVP
jgi:SAM-dependent MidA family methyltransferase